MKYFQSYRKSKVKLCFKQCSKDGVQGKDQIKLKETGEVLRRVRKHGIAQNSSDAGVHRVLPARQAVYAVLYVTGQKMGEWVG